MSIQFKHKGAHSELIASAWLLSHGYEVFRNISQFGPVDIIGIRDGVITLFEVKTGSGAKLRPDQKDKGIKIINVAIDGSCVIDEEPKVIISRLHTDEVKNCRNCGTKLIGPCSPYNRRYNDMRPKDFCNNLCKNNFYLKPKVLNR